MIINEKVISSNFNAKLKVIKKSKRLKRKRNNLNPKSIKTRIISMKEIQINKFNFENQNTISKTNFKNILGLFNSIDRFEENNAFPYYFYAHS